MELVITVTKSLRFFVGVGLLTVGCLDFWNEFEDEVLDLQFLALFGADAELEFDGVTFFDGFGDIVIH